jgi:nucleoside-diphosphate-sugar epimerase
MGVPGTTRIAGDLAGITGSTHDGSMTDSLVLVTGGSGFIAGHCIAELLQQGFRVRTTVRSLTREAKVREVLAKAGVTRGSAVEFVAADLTRDEGWADAVAGIDAVLHVASPVRPGKVDDEDEVIGPARDGALRVLRAARDAGVRRVVLTSAFHAAGFGHPHSHDHFTEDDWSIPDGPGVDAYGRSKILSERAAWKFVESEGRGLELVTLLPVAVMGPVMGAEISGSNQLLQRMLTGALPGMPRLYIPIVDVRDVATAHVAAINAPGASGQRFLIASGEPAIAMSTIADTLRARLGDAAAKVPTRQLPNFVVRVGALFNVELRSVAAELGLVKKVSIDKARRVLGFSPRTSEEAIVAAGKSMIAAGLV